MKTVIEMAHKAGILAVTSRYSLDQLERFAELVRADEREKLDGQTAVEIHEAVLEEREAVIDIVMNAPFSASMSKKEFDGEKGVSVKALAFQICSEIRARGQS